MHSKPKLKNRHPRRYLLLPVHQHQGAGSSLFDVTILCLQQIFSFLSIVWSLLFQLSKMHLSTILPRLPNPLPHLKILRPPRNDGTFLKPCLVHRRVPNPAGIPHLRAAPMSRRLVDPTPPLRLTSAWMVIGVPRTAQGSSLGPKPPISLIPSSFRLSGWTVPNGPVGTSVCTVPVFQWRLSCTFNSGIQRPNLTTPNRHPTPHPPDKPRTNKRAVFP